jgi:hypothetical protein
MNTNTQLLRRRPRLAAATALLSLGCLALLASGCGRSGDDKSDGHGKIKISYLGLTCEPPIFVAYEKGFFKEEGLDVELVKTNWDSLREGLGLGRFDPTHHLVMYVVKPIESGLDVKITGGIHTGCLKVQAGTNTDIKKVTIRPEINRHTPRCTAKRLGRLRAVIRCVAPKMRKGTMKATPTRTWIRTTSKEEGVCSKRS